MFKRRKNKKNMSAMTPLQQSMLRGGQSNTDAYNRMLGTGTSSSPLTQSALETATQRSSQPITLEESYINRVGSRPNLMSQVGNDPQQTKQDAIDMGFNPRKTKRLVAASEYQRRMSGEQPTDIAMVDETGFGDPSEYLELDLGGFDGMDSSGMGQATGTLSGYGQSYDSVPYNGPREIMGMEVNSLTDLQYLRSRLMKMSYDSQYGSYQDVVNDMKELTGSSNFSPDQLESIQQAASGKFDAPISYLDALIASESKRQDNAYNLQFESQGQTPISLGEYQFSPQEELRYKSFGIDPQEAKNDPFIGAMLLTRGGKQLSQGQVEGITELFGVTNRILQLTDVMDKKSTGKVAGVFRGINPLDLNAQQFKASVTSALPGIARGVFGEVGVLTDTDMARYAQVLPSLTNRKDVNKALMLLALQGLRTQMGTTIGTLGDAGYDVSGQQAQLLQTMSQIKQIESELGIPPAQNQGQQFTPQQIQEVVDSGLYTMEEIQQFIGGASFNNESQTSLNGNDITALSSKFESTGDPGAIGYDSGGGMSYGTYQLAHNNVIDFINRSGLAQYFPNQDKNSKQFQATWKALAQRNPQQFEKLQKDYIMQTHYQPQVQKLAQSGIDVNTLPSSIQQAIFSTAVQHGANTNLIAQAAQKSRNNQELLYNIYQLRANQIINGKLKPNEKQAVLNRYKQEYRLAAQGLSSNLA